MKTLIYGHRGWIGGQFIDYLEKNKVENYFLGKSRLDNIFGFKKELDEVVPSHVVCFIGRTHGVIDNISYPTIDYLEQPGKLKENIRDNLFAPISIVLECSKRNIHVTYLGTGCIFSYNGMGPADSNDCHHEFTEDDVPNFTGSGYSTVKGFTDRLMHQFNDSVLNLRIRMPIVGYDCARNFITKIKTYQKVCSMPNSMTVLPDIVPAIYQMMEKNITGTINLTNPGYITHDRILELYRDQVDNSFTWENFTMEEQNKVIESQRSNNVLCTKTIEKLGDQGVIDKIPDIETSIYKLFKNYKTNSSFTKQIKGIPDVKSTVILVTGGAGFIGSVFINYLHSKTNNLKIINFDALYYAGSINNVNQEVRDSDRYSFIHGNLKSFDLLKYLFQTKPITHVVHFAAQSHVQTSFEDSLNYTADNVVGTHNLLETCRLYCPNLMRFIHVSTDEVYGESMLATDEKCKTESEVLCPTNPYAATKAAAELIAQSYFHSFKMPIIITRGNNVYGKNQYPEKVIPRFMNQLKNNQKVTIQGNGSVVRAFLHSSDAAKAFYIILNKGEIGEIYNIGCDEDMEYSILDLAKMLIKLIKNTENYDQWITYIDDRPFNDTRYYISNQKLKDLGWDISVKFLDGLSSLIK